jgi:hypothetical protein
MQLPVKTRERMEDMRGADYSRFPEILDAQEKLQGVLQPEMGAVGVRKVLLDSRIPLKPFPRFLARSTRHERT